MDNLSGINNLAAPPVPPNAVLPQNAFAAEDDTSFVKQLSSIVMTNVKNIPQSIKQNFIWLTPLFLIWVLFAIIPNYGLPSFLQSFVGLVIFLTATYNNFVGKALMGGFIGGYVIPLLKEAKGQGLGKAIKNRLDRNVRVFKLVGSSFKEKGMTGLMMLVGFGGLGFIFSNFLSRNSKIDKYLVVLLTAIGLFNTLTHGLQDPIVKLIRAFWRDVSKLAKKSNIVTTGNIYIAVSSVALAMAASVVFNFIRVSNNFDDPTGYIVGAVMLVGSIVWYIVGGKKFEKR